MIKAYQFYVSRGLDPEYVRESLAEGLFAMSAAISGFAQRCTFE